VKPVTPQNPLQLTTKVQLASNATDDSQLLVEALPNLKERTELDKIYTDGGYGGPDSDVVLQEQQVEHIQTSIRGRTLDPEKLHLADFAIKFSIQTTRLSKSPARMDRPSQRIPAAFRRPLQRGCVFNLPTARQVPGSTWQTRLTPASAFHSGRSTCF
jgi:hypothetical protein